MENELWDAIEHYGKGLERIILSTLIAIHQGLNVINLGPPGQGKTFCTKSLCDTLNIPYTLVAGHKSPKEFFELFKRDGLIIIDESATLIRNPKIMDMLLSALWDGTVEWSNNRERIVHKFSGTIIFNTNSIPGNAFMIALKDRCIFNEINLNPSELKEIWLKEDIDYSNSWKTIKNRMDNDVELTDDEELLIKRILSTVMLRSLRTPIKIFQIAKFLKAIFGEVDKIVLFINVNSIHEIVYSDIKESEKIKKIAKLKKVSYRQASNILTKYKKGGI